MAKAVVRKRVVEEPTVTTVVTPEIATPAPISARLRNLVNQIRRPFLAFSEGLEALTTSRAQFAPQFMRAYGTYMNEVGGSFVGFVRLLDPSVPEDRESYRNHRSYQAASYLRRLVNQAEAAAERTRRREAGEEAAPTPLMLMLARTIRTLIDLTGDDEVVWVVAAEVGIRPRSLERLQNLTEEAEPIPAATPTSSLRRAQRGSSAGREATQLRA